jgi:adenosine/AMP kinase
MSVAHTLVSECFAANKLQYIKICECVSGIECHLRQPLQLFVNSTHKHIAYVVLQASQVW